MGLLSDGRVADRLAVSGLILIQFCLLLATILRVGAYGWDDGTITLAFARTFASSGKIALTPISEQVEGFSTTSWFLLNSLFAVFRPSFSRAIFLSQFSTVLTLVGCTIVLYRLCLAEQLSRISLYFVLVVFILLGPSFSEAVNGMEMGLLAFTGLLIFYALYARPSILIASLAIPVFVGTRFEAIFYLGFIVLPLLVRGDPRRFLLIAAYGGLWFLLFSIWRWAYFHALIPNTILAKMNPVYHSVGGVRAHYQGAIDILRFFIPAFAFLLIRAAHVDSGLKKLASAPSSRLPLFYPVAGAIVFGLIAGVNWGYAGRMQFFAAPFLLLILGRALDALKSDSDFRQICLSAALGIVTVFLASASLPREGLRLARTHGFGVTPAAYRETALAVEKVRTGAGLDQIKFVTPDVGGVGLCCSDIDIIDLGLLSNRRMAREGYSALEPILAAERPEVIEVHGLWAEHSGIYGLEEFQKNYRPALADHTRLFVRTDIADKLVQDAKADVVKIDDAAALSAILDSRYATTVSTADDVEFLKRFAVTVVH